MTAKDKNAALVFEPHSFMLSALATDLANPISERSYERHVGQMVAERYPDAIKRGATALPTRHFLRDLIGANTRDLTAGTAATGGDLVFGRMIDVADAARPQNALDVAGVPRLELSATGPVAFPRWVAETSLGGWVAEGGTAGTTNLTVKEVTATPRSAYATVTISRRLSLQTAFDVEQAILRELAAATRATLEDGFINGDGSSNKPLGLLNVSSATTNTWAGATPTHAELITQLQNYTENHGRLDQARWLANSDLIARLMAAEATASTGVFRLAMADSQPTILGVPVVISEALPDTRLVLFNPQQARTVYWGAPAAMADRASGMLRGDVRLIVYNDADCVVLHPEQFCIGKAAA